MLHNDNLHLIDDLMPEEVRERMRTRSKERIAMRIGIIGGGVVGSAMANAFRGYVDSVNVHDVVEERSTHDIDEALECDVVFVCLPTPRASDNLGTDLTCVEEFFQSVASNYAGLNKINYVLRSTVPVGTTRMLREKYRLPNLVHSPEFLTARTADYDAANPRVNVIGYPDMGYYPSDGKMHPIAKLYYDRFPDTPVYYLTSDESEAVKLFQNAFSAVKVAAFNELRTFADNRGLRWDVVRATLLSNGFINLNHTEVPGPDGKFGYGGSCLPKDAASLEHQMLEDGLLVTMLTAARIRNEEDRKR